MKNTQKKTDAKNLPLQAVTMLLKNYTAPTEFYQHIYQQIQDVMSEVKAGTLYTLEMLCGKEFWQILGNAYCRRLAGRCFAHMVHQGLFPFEFVQYKRSATKRYRLKVDI